MHQRDIYIYVYIYIYIYIYACTYLLCVLTFKKDKDEVIFKTETTHLMKQPTNNVVL